MENIFLMSSKDTETLFRNNHKLNILVRLENDKKKLRRIFEKMRQQIKYHEQQLDDKCLIQEFDVCIMEETISLYHKHAPHDYMTSSYAIEYCNKLLDSTYAHNHRALLSYIDMEVYTSTDRLMWRNRLEKYCLVVIRSTIESIKNS